MCFKPDTPQPKPVAPTPVPQPTPPTPPPTPPEPQPAPRPLPDESVPTLKVIVWSPERMQRHIDYTPDDWANPGMGAFTRIQEQVVIIRSDWFPIGVWGRYWMDDFKAIQTVSQVNRRHEILWLHEAWFHAVGANNYHVADDGQPAIGRWDIHLMEQCSQADIDKAWMELSVRYAAVNVLVGDGFGPATPVN